MEAFETKKDIFKVCQLFTSEDQCLTKLEMEVIDEEIYHRTFSSFEILLSESARLQNITYDKAAAFQSENNCRLLV